MRRFRTFYILTVTQALSLIGSRMTGLAVGIWVFAQTGDVAPILLTSFFLEVPGMLGASLAGVLADRWDRRHVIMLGDAGEAAGTLFLMLSFTSGDFQLWHLYLAALVKGSFMTLQAPAADAAIAMLVPQTHRERANAIKEMAFPLAGVVAPAVAGFLYALIDVTGIILIDLATFGIAILVVGLIRIPRPRPSEEGEASAGGIWAELRGGLRFLTRRRALLGLVVYFTFVNFLLNGPLELSIPYIVSVTGSEATLGLLMAVMSLGALAGAGLIAVWGGTRPRIHTLLPGLILTGVMMALYGLARNPWLLGLTLFALMIPLPVSNALLKSILQVKTPADIQGRVFSVVLQLAFVATPVSFLLTGVLVDRIMEPAVGGPGWGLLALLFGREAGAGMGLVIAAAGALIVISSALLYTSPGIRSLEADLPDFEAMPEDTEILPAS